MILLTGASGYIGGRLLTALEARGEQVRCLARRPEYLAPRVGPSTEIVKGDLLDPASLRPAMRGIGTAYYLVHSMGSDTSFEEEDRAAASAFAGAAREAGVGRIVYLGGLGSGSALSAHLASRQEVGRILSESGVPTVEFRASIIIGSGSLSFELVRALVKKLPVMVTPRWVRTPTQPIAVEDVIDYLVAALDVPLPGSAIFEIGGADRVSYLDLMREYARQSGLRRAFITVPVLTPWLSSLWLGLVTPVYARVGRKLIEGVRNETVVEDARALSVFPVRPRGMSEAIARALAHEDHPLAPTRWADALSSRGAVREAEPSATGARLLDSRTLRVPCPPSAAWRPIERIGGETGWYYGNWLWRIRGLMDLAAGGAGMRRGRRDPDRLAVGETVDFWRVEALERGRLLRLAAEMKVPGRAWLEFEVGPDPAGCVIRQTAIFLPAGLAGRLYWYALYPAHLFVFSGMLRAIGRAARRER